MAVKSFKLIDISLKGVLVKAPHGWLPQTGESAALTLSLDGAGAEIKLLAQLAHRESNQLGFLCDEIDMDSITHLRRLVELNLGDSSLLERELEALG